VAKKGKRGNGEADVYPRKNKDGKVIGYRGPYWVQTADGPKRRYVSGKTKTEARAKLAKARATRDEGLIFDTENMTLREYLERWLNDSVRARLRPSTYESYSWLIRKHIAPTLGNVKLKALSAAHLQSFYCSKSDEGLTRTVEYLHDVLHAALKQAVRWGMVPRNVADAVDPPKTAKKERDYLSLEEVKILWEAAKGDRFETLYILAVTTGMRRGELLGLKWADIDLDREMLAVRRALAPDGKTFTLPKNGKGRSIRLTPQAVKALERHRKAQDDERSKLGNVWKENGLVFPSTVGTPMNPDNLVYRSFKPLLRRAGLKEIRFHDLRHTFGYLMLEAGEHPKVVQEMLGHSQISLTLDTYSHVLPDIQKEAIRRLGGLLP
jgi:integrase